MVIIAPSGDFSKPRPAVVVQAHHPQGMETFTVLPITSALERLPAIRVPVTPDDTNGLNKPSEIMVDNVQTLLLKRVGERIGKVDETTLLRVNMAMTIFLGLP